MDIRDLEIAGTLMTIGWMTTTFLIEHPDVMPKFEEWVKGREDVSIEKNGGEFHITEDLQVASRNFLRLMRNYQEEYILAAVVAALEQTEC